MKPKLLPLLLFPVIIGCTSIDVTPVDTSHNLSYVAIKENPKVDVPRFEEVIQKGFNSHGIDTVMYSGDTPPNGCQAILTYTALRSWDFSPYLSHAEIWIKDMQGQQIGYAKYHLEGKGGLDLSKWSSVETKMEPVIDQLLAVYDGANPRPKVKISKSAKEPQALSAPFPTNDLKIGQLKSEVTDLLGPEFIVMEASEEYEVIAYRRIISSEGNTSSHQTLYLKISNDALKKWKLTNDTVMAVPQNL